MNFSDFCKLVELRHSKFHFSVGSYLRDGESPRRWAKVFGAVICGGGSFAKDGLRKAG